MSTTSDAREIPTRHVDLKWHRSLRCLQFDVRTSWRSVGTVYPTITDNNSCGKFFVNSTLLLHSSRAASSLVVDAVKASTFSCVGRTDSTCDALLQLNSPSVWRWLNSEMFTFESMDRMPPLASHLSSATASKLASRLLLLKRMKKCE